MREWIRCKQAAALLGLLIFLAGCGVSDLADQPQVTLERSEAGSLTTQGTSRIITFYINSSVAKKASKVAYYLDDTKAEGKAWKVSKKAPFKVRLDTAELESGKHTITALAYVDDHVLKGSASFEVDHGDDGAGRKSIAELAAANKKLSTLVSALEQAGLADTLSEDVEGGLTVFAPTNKAFAALDALPEGDALAEVLTYHVVEGTLLADDLVEKSTVETLNGADIEVEVVDGEVILNGTVKVVKANIKASNGVVHVIDAVLLPEAEPETGGAETGGSPEPEPGAETILDIAAESEELSTLVSAAEQAGLSEALAAESEAGLTVFAPTDDAFAALDALPEGDALEEVLTYHVVEGTFTARDLADEGTLSTLAGADVEVEVSDDGVTLNGSVRVTEADIEASNGVVHIIDAVLTPPESEPEPEPEPEPEEPTEPGSAREEVLELVNEARSSGYRCAEGYFGPTGPLELDSRLTAAAKVQADHLADDARFNHTGPGGSGLADRVNAEDYRWSRLAENIAAGQSTPKEAVEAWLTSDDGHCSNIMNPDLKEMGAAATDGASFGVKDDGSVVRYEGLQWVQVFARSQ